MFTQQTKLLLFSLALLCATGVGAASAHAATLTLVADKATASINEPVRFNVVLDAQGQDINAVQATVSFASDRFAVAAVSDANSIVNFWVTAPQVTAAAQGTTQGQITFSGIMPGGYRGATGTVMSFVLTPQKSGAGVVSITNTTVLLNDGEGTAAAVKTKGETITVSSSGYSGSSSSLATASAGLNASSSPEAFTPLISRDFNMFDGKYFVAFSTTDKGSGIDHYEVLEVPAGTALGSNPASNSAWAWQTATSPYLLTDQNLASDVYVRAVNHAGNATIGKVPAAFPPSHNRAVDIAVLIGGALMVLLILWIMRRRRA